MPATYSAYRDFDFNHDGRVGSDEWAVGYMTGKISLDHPSYRGAFSLLKEVTRFFQPGWTGLARDEAIFKFAQQKAIFISSGLWEVNGLEQLADGRFEIGIMDFPLPRTDDPEFGRLIEGPRYENPAGIFGGNVPFAITKTSLHQDIALDFLLFLVSREQNEKFNERLGWLPIIEGARSSPNLKIFEPTLEGVFPAFFPALGGESVIEWQQLQTLFMVGQLDYSKMSADYAAFYRDKGRADLEEYLRNILRSQPQQGQLAADMRAIALGGGGNGTSDAWSRYRGLALSPIDAEKNARYYRDLISDPDRTRKMPLYQYTPEAWDRLRATYAPSTVPKKNQKP
jgi:ABC-type glycerol-3-phosphate transport system substrate-binding protein